jgi:fatty acid desaturase
MEAKDRDEEPRRQRDRRMNAGQAIFTIACFVIGAIAGNAFFGEFFGEFAWFLCGILGGFIGLFFSEG